MFITPYSHIFKSQPLTVRDKAKDILKFLEREPSPVYFDATRNVLSRELRVQLLHLHDQNGIPPQLSTTEEEDQAIIKTVQLLSDIAPKLYQNRSFVGVTELHTSQSLANKLTREDPVFDNDGNKSLLNVMIFLYSGVLYKEGDVSSWFIQSKKMSFDDTRDLCVIYDNSIGYIHPPVRGKQVLLHAKLLYSTLPVNSFHLTSDEQQLIWRGLMRKCFHNTFQYDSAISRKCSTSPTSTTSTTSTQQFDQDDILKDQCECCLAFISIDSDVCPFCKDKLVKIPIVISNRKKGIWLSHWD